MEVLFEGKDRQTVVIRQTMVMCLFLLHIIRVISDAYRSDFKVKWLVHPNMKILHHLLTLMSFKTLKKCLSSEHKWRYV